MVPEVGLEPTRSNEQRILSPLCLPFHHPGLKVAPREGYDPSTSSLTVKRSTN